MAPQENTVEDRFAIIDAIHRYCHTPDLTAFSNPVPMTMMGFTDPVLLG